MLSPIEMDAKIREAFDQDTNNGVAGDRIYAKALYWAAQIEAYFKENDLFEMGLNEDDEDRYYSIDNNSRNFLNKYYEALSRDCAETGNQTKPSKEKKTELIDDSIDEELTDITSEIAESIINEELYRDWETFCRSEILSVLPGKVEEEIRGMDKTVEQIFEKKKFKYPFAALETVLSIISYINDDISLEDAEIAVSSFLKNCSMRLKKSPGVMAFIYCVVIKFCAENLSCVFTIKQYESNKELLQQCETKVDYSDVLSMCAPLYMENDADEALEMLTEAYEIRIKLYTEKAAIVGITLCQISSVYHIKRDHQKAVETAIMAYNAFPEDEQTIQLGLLLVNAVHSYYDMGKYDECPKWIEIAKKIYKKNKNQPGATLLFLELSIAAGNYHMATGQPAIAEKYYRDGISMGEKCDPTDTTLEKLRLNLSILLGKIVGDTQTAKDVISEYTSTGELVPSGNNALSLMYRSLAYYAETNSDFEKTAKWSLDEILANPKTPSHLQKLIYARALLINNKHRSHRDEITRLIGESEDEITRLNLHHSDVGIELSACKANFALLLYNYEDAKKYADEALHLAKNSYLLYETHLFCGQLQLSMGKREKALSHFASALNTVLSRLNTAKKYLCDSRVRDYLNAIRVVTNFYYSLTTTGKTSATHEEQYDVLLKTKALPSLIEKVKKDATIINPKQRQLLEAIKSLRKSSSTNDAERIRQLEMEYAVADTIVLIFPETRHGDIQRKLPLNSAIVEFFEYVQIDNDVFRTKLEKRMQYIWYAVFVTTKDANGNIGFERVRDVDSCFVSQAAKELRYANENLWFANKILSNAGAKNDKRQTADFSRKIASIRNKIVGLRKKLYNLIVKDIYPYIKGCERLYIAPDSDLSTIPFEILGVKNYLMDEFKIIYLETGRDINSNSGFIDTDGVSLVVGNPQYEIIRTDIIKKPKIQDMYNQRGSDTDDELPLSNLEAQIVAQRLGTMPYLGESATKFIVINSNNPNIIHISTHGEVRDLDLEPERIPINPMAQSYLKMAGVKNAKRKGEDDPKYGDGLLSASEVAQSDFSQTNLVVLSACVTGLGKKVYSEVVGMRTAFKVAGAKHTVVSLWRVDDFATAIFMDLFYSYLKKHDVNEALRIAKLDMRTITVGKLQENGWLSRTQIDKMGASVLIAEQLVEMPYNYKPFMDEVNWAGFICQTN